MFVKHFKKVNFPKRTLRFKYIHTYFFKDDYGKILDIFEKEI